MLSLIDQVPFTPGVVICSSSRGARVFSSAVYPVRMASSKLALFICSLMEGSPFRLSIARKAFYPKPRVALGKSPQPLRCNPIVIEQIGPQRDDGGAIGPSPPHASLFHAAVDHQGHRSLDHAAAHRIAKLAPVLIGPNPRTLVLQIRDRLRDGLKWLGWQSCSQGAQSLHRLIDAAMPEPRPVQEQLVVSFSLREGLGSCRHSDGVTDLAPQMRPV